MNISAKILYLTRDGKVYKVPKTGKAIPELSEQEVLEVVMKYEIVNRKPLKILSFIFNNRFRLDNNGQKPHNTEHEELKEAMTKIDLEINLPSWLQPKKVTETNVINIPHLPKKPIKPTTYEIEVLKEYLMEKEPLLYKNSPGAIYMAIAEDEALFKRHKTTAIKRAN